MKAIRATAAVLLLAGCAVDAPEPPAPPPATLRVAKEGSALGRIDLFHYHPTAGRLERLAHCPEGCAETLATLPSLEAELEVVATGWPYLRMSGFKNLAPCVRSDGGFMSPCRFKLADVPADGVVAIFYARPGVPQPEDE
jgi:hypothetical protein